MEEDFGLGGVRPRRRPEPRLLPREFQSPASRSFPSSLSSPSSPAVISVSMSTPKLKSPSSDYKTPQSVYDLSFETPTTAKPKEMRIEELFSAEKTERMSNGNLRRREKAIELNETEAVRRESFKRAKSQSSFANLLVGPGTKDGDGYATASPIAKANAPSSENGNVNRAAEGDVEDVLRHEMRRQLKEVREEMETFRRKCMDLIETAIENRLKKVEAKQMELQMELKAATGHRRESGSSRTLEQFVMSTELRSELRAVVKEEVEALRRQTTEQIQRFINEVRAEVRSIGQSPQLRSPISSK